MFGSKKKQPPKERKRTNLATLGLMDVESIEDDNDDDLEAELNKLMGGGNPKRKPKKPAKDDVDLESMVAACMKEEFSDEEDDNLEEDPELLNELAELDDDHEDNDKQPTGCGELQCPGEGLLATIDERIIMYSTAEKRAKDAGETSRARRFSRGLATLTDLKRKVKTGKAISDDDIPPAINVQSPRKPPLKDTPPQPPVEPPPVVFERQPPLSPVVQPSLPPPTVQPSLPPPTVQPSLPSPAVLPPVAAQPLIQHLEPLEPVLPVIQNKPPAMDMVTEKLNTEREKYKEFALTAKTAGNKDHAVFGLRAVKLCDALLAKAANGEDVGNYTNQLPDLPTATMTSPPKLQRTFGGDEPIQLPENPEDIPPPDPSTFGAPPPPITIFEALNQRLERYKSDEAKAKAEGNASRARRLGRICKQYQDAIKLHKSGRQFPMEELPTPPGFGPIPTSDPPTAALRPLSKPPLPATTGALKKSHPEPPAIKRSLTLQEKQLLLLEKRQGQFKAAALEAKKAGDIDQAREYLRQAKGFDKLIEASKGGFSVDLSTLPVPPQEKKDVTMGFEIVSEDDCVEPPKDLQGTDRQSMYHKLEQDLLSQVKMCETNMTYFKSTGEVSSMNKFQQLMEHTKRDLDALRFAFKRAEPVPKFHYEIRAFSKIVCNPDLSDLDLELSVIRGINYNVQNPKEVDTYCRLEFPYPKETPFKDKTALIKDTNNPEYNHVCVVPLNLRDKGCQRIFKRQSAKVEVWSKGGFLRSDTLVGTASIKLQPLETLCTIHDTWPLMDGRKAVGGKVEAKIRLRNAIVSKQVERVEEKWLVVSFK